MSLNTGLAMNVGGGQMGMTMTGASPSMFHPQPSLGINTAGVVGGLSTPSPMLQPSTTPSPNPFTTQMQPQAFGSSSLGQPNQPLLSTSPALLPQGSPMFSGQPLGQMPMQGSPMFQPQSLGQPQMQMQIPGAMGGNPFMQMQSQPQPQMMTGFQPQPQFAGPSPGMFMQQQQPQQQMFGQTNPFGGVGWQQTGFPGQQQQWGGGM